ncbi:MAG: aspartate kinase, partial [Christensenellales bacterium]
MLIVQKFGGSSVADAERIRRVAGIIADAHAHGDGPVVVLSARGDTTDTLLENAGEITQSPQRRELDVLLSTGELGSVALMAMQLHSMGLDCVSLSGRQAGIFTDTVHGAARILDISTDRLHRELKAGKIVLVAG